MKNRKIEEKPTKQLVIEAELHRLLKMKASKSGIALKTLIEGYLVEHLTEEDYATR